MDSLKEEKKKKFIVNFLYFAVIALILWLCFKYVIPIVFPLLLGFFIAAVVQPAVGFMSEKLRMNRKASGVIAVLLFIILLAAFLTFGLSWLLSELSAVFSMFPSIITKFVQSFDGLAQKFSGMINQLPTDLSQRLGSGISNISTELSKMSSLTSGVASAAAATVSRVPGTLLAIIVTVVSACFISSDYPKIRGFFMRQLPKKYQEWAMDLKEFFFITLGRLFKAYLTLMLITFVELCIWLTLMHIPHAIMISALIAIVDILPVLGTGTVVIPWAVIEFIMGNWHLGVLLIIMYGCILVVRNIIEPKIVGYHIGLYPLVTLASLYIGLKMFGAAGMFLFPITAIIIKHMHDTGKIKIWKDNSEPESGKIKKC